MAEAAGIDHEDELVRQALARSSRSARARLSRLRRAAGPIAQAAVAAAAAWVLARLLPGHSTPFFAPIAAIITLTATRGRRVRHAIELMIGVALGIGVADVFLDAIGTGIAQLALVVGLAMAAATLLDASGTLLTEAAVSAALVATIEPTTQGFPPTRFLDALIGGAIALTFSQLLFPAHPLRIADQAARSILDRLARALEAVAGALEARDVEAAQRALAEAHGVREEWWRFQRALDAAREAARYAPPRRRLRAPFAAYQGIGLPLDLLVRDVQVLARASLRALDIGDPVPESVPGLLRELARATERISGEVRDADESEAHEAALGATRAATTLAPDDNISLSLLVGHIQATAADLLRALGHDREHAHEEVGQAAREARAVL